jgi:hypothetical protein
LIIEAYEYTACREEKVLPVVSVLISGDIWESSSHRIGRSVHDRMRVGAFHTVESGFARV